MKFEDNIRDIINKEGLLTFTKTIQPTDSYEIKKVSWLITFGFIETSSIILDIDKYDNTF